MNLSFSAMTRSSVVALEASFVDPGGLSELLQFLVGLATRPSAVVWTAAYCWCSIELWS